MNNKIHKILAKYWGYRGFRSKQEEIIESVLSGKDTLALLPTGGGKSICFQVPAIAKEGLCLVVSPLIALMEDQVNNLKKRGIKAIAINSGMGKRAIDIALDNAAYGDIKFLYISPERIGTEIFQERLKKMNVNLLAVDEAHCISQWGHDFRPAYLQIGELRKQLKDVPCIALTATATEKVANEIQEKLGFKEENKIQKSFKREKLAYVVLKEEDTLKRMQKVIKGVKGSGLIYVGKRKKCREIASLLNQQGICSDYYHAGLSFEERQKKQKSWVQNETRVMVSTNAFGMGIDKPDVRFVIHLDLPSSLEAYFQEAGRAGRDGKKAYAVLLLGTAMTQELRKRTEQSFPSIEKIKKCYLSLGNYFQLPVGAGEGQRFLFDIQSFCRRYKLDINETYNALKFLMKEGLIQLSEGYENSSSNLFFSTSKEELYKFQIANKAYDKFLKTILRTYTGLFTEEVKISEQQIAKSTGKTVRETKDLLKKLDKLELVNYEAKNNTPQISYLTERREQNGLKISKSNYLDRKKIAFNQMEAVILFAESEHRCRSQLLLEYFDEKNSDLCGVCDVCLAEKKANNDRQNTDTIKGKILTLLKKNKKSSQEIVDHLSSKREEEVLEILSKMSDNKEIATDGFKFWKS